MLLLVLRPDGYLYDKEAIVENMLHQKRDIAKKLKEYEKQKGKQQVREKTVLFYYTEGDSDVIGLLMSFEPNKEHLKIKKEDSKMS